MITIADFKINQDHQEILPMNSSEFPYLCNYANLDRCIDKSFPWHWHSAFEVDYIAEGEVEFRTADDVFHLKKGDAIFFNSNVMHDIHAQDKKSGCQLYAHLFDPHFISGTPGSIFEQKYIAPILQNAELSAYVIRPDNYRRIQMIEKLLHITELTQKEGFGYEFEIRSQLCRFWCLLLEETQELPIQHSRKNHADTERIKLMIQYIREHYSEKITLDDICASAAISSRECTRCFQRSIGISPITYLNDFRIRMAAQLLLGTDDSILTISENCGFSSVSYFGKVFSETMKCTPREYRIVGRTLI